MTEPSDPIWLAGRIVDRDEFRIDPACEGIVFGRGVFSTTRSWERKRIWFWSDHRLRLLQSAAAIGVPLDPTQLPTESALLDLVRQCGGSDRIVRVCAAKQGDASLVWATTRAISDAPTGGLRLIVSSHRVSRFDPFAALKCFNYGIRNLAFEEAAAAGADDALLLDLEGRVLETSRANVFFRTSQEWSTPALSGGVLGGVVRAKVLQRTEVQERLIDSSELPRVVEAFATNSGRGVMPISRIGNHETPVGEFTLSLQKTMEEAAAIGG